MSLDPILIVFTSLVVFLALVSVIGYQAAAYYDRKHESR